MSLRLLGDIVLKRHRVETGMSLVTEQGKWPEMTGLRGILVPFATPFTPDEENGISYSMAYSWYVHSGSFPSATLRMLSHPFCARRGQVSLVAVSYTHLTLPTKRIV